MGSTSSEAAAAPALRLRFLARPALVRADGHEHPLSAKDAALLMLLARRGPAERDALAALLWPGSTPKAARVSLRQRDFRLREQAGRALLGKDGPLALAAGVAHDLGDPLPRLAEDPSALAAPLLAGFDYDDTPELAQAVDRERQRWRDEIREALMRLIARREAAGEIAGAMACAQRLVAEEPTSEHAARLLMRLHHRRGDRAAALEAFEALKRRLFDSLHEAPADETVRLAHEIDRGHVPIAPPVPVLPLALRHPPATLGRAALVGALSRRLLDGAPVLLVGPAGIGKTRVFEDLLLALRPPVVCRLQAEDRDDALALARRLAGALLAALPAPAEVDDAALLRWLAAPAAAPGPGSVSATRLHDAFGAALAALAAFGGAGAAIVAVDDLHFADDESAALLARLLREGPRRPWLLTTRDGALPTALAAWLDEQAGDDEAQFDITPLEATAFAPLLAGVLAPGANLAAWSAALAGHCGGHPLSVLQVLRALHGQGQLGGTLPPAALPVPREALQRAARRLERCDARAQALAYAAALGGGDFDAEVARHVLGGSASELVAPWRELQAAGLMREQGYTHELVRQAVIEMVPVALAPVIHGEIGRALCAIGSAPARRVRHWVAAGRWAEAGADEAAAAEDALAAGLRGAARERWRLAAAHFEQAGRHDEAFEACARALPLTLSTLSAEEAMTEARALMAQARTPHQRCSALIALARVTSERHDPAGRALALDALQQAQALGDAALQAQTVLRVAVAHHVAGDHAQALDLLDARRADRHRLSPLEDQEFRDTEALVLAALGRRRDAVAIFVEAYGRAEAERDLAATAEYAGNAAIQLGYLCESERALGFADAALAIERRIGAGLAFSAVNAMSVAGLCIDLGRYTRALEVGQSCLDALRRSGLAHFTISAEHTLATAYLQLGRPDLAHPLLADAPADAPPWARALRRAAQGGLAHARGESPLPAARDARRMLAGLGAFYSGYVRCRIDLEEARWSEDAAHTVEVATRCIDWALAHEHVALERPARVVEIEGLLQLGRSADAARRADELAAHGATGWATYNFYLPELWWTLVRAWDAAGRAAPADALARQAAGWIRSCADRDVPALFRASFLQRNPANVSLLRRAGAAGGQ